MGLRLLISRLSASPTRLAAARALAVLCAVGFLLTLIVLAAAGAPREQWVFVLLVWALFVYAPLRILLEAAQTFAPALRRRLAGAPRAALELVVDRLLEQEVVMPRIATPVQGEKARAGALAVLTRTSTGGGSPSPAAAAALACVDQWVRGIGPWAARDAGQNIQARWEEVRALAALAAMTKVLVAAQDDQPSRAPGRTVDRRADDGRAAAFLDACLDYCDDLALDLEVAPWAGPAPASTVAADGADRVRETWKTYCATGAPAVETRRAFVETLISAAHQDDPPLHE